MSPKASRQSAWLFSGSVDEAIAKHRNGSAVLCRRCRAPLEFIHTMELATQRGVAPGLYCLAHPQEHVIPILLNFVSDEMRALLGGRDEDPTEPRVRGPNTDRKKC